MISKKIMLLAPSVVLGAMVMAADTPAPAASQVPGAETLENVGRQKKFFDISEMVRKANGLMADSKYDEAIKVLKENVINLFSYEKYANEIKSLDKQDKEQTRFLIFLQKCWKIQIIATTYLVVQRYRD